MKTNKNQKNIVYLFRMFILIDISWFQRQLFFNDTNLNDVNI